MLLTRIKKQSFVTVIALCFIFVGSIICAGFSGKLSVGSVKEISIDSFAGSLSCRNCHKDIYDTHIHTAHYLSSKPASEEYIKGSFDSGQNKFIYNKFMEVALEKTGSGFFQTSLINGAPLQSERFDIVVGSGRKGQTYLYWNENRLYQLPVSYYSPLKSWCNSPGYIAGFINYMRPISSRCIECHGTYAKAETIDSVTIIFDKESIIYGVDCERCHGPSAAHVKFHTDNPNNTISKYTINPKLLSRQQRLDACALCHSGLRKQVKPSFSFMEGDRLEDFSLLTYDKEGAPSLDVHGNQYGLLTSSKCFLKSGTMDCSSCHNVHKEEIKAPELFSMRCMNCHNENLHNNCTLPEVKNKSLTSNCIDCHMPVLPSNQIFLQLDDPKKSTPDFVRTHRIAIYPDATKAFLKKIKNK